MSVVALVLGALALLGTLLATVRVNHPAETIFPVMMIGWLVGELAVFHLVAQVVAVTLLAVTGATGNALGGAGLVAFAASIGGLVAVQRTANRAPQVFERALRDGLGDGYADRLAAELASAIEPPPGRQAWRPFRFDQRGVEVLKNLTYGEHPKRNRLDIVRPAGTTAGAGLPVVLFAHGGAWVIGNKEQQGRPMLLHLARRGYVGVTINYRLAPRHRWPAQIIDVKRAIAWVHEHGDDYGGDPSCLVVAGASAGGHLVALAALTPGDPAFQPGFEDADTTVAACIPIYAPFDLTDQSGRRGRAALRRFLDRLVMPTRLRDDPAAWQAASPQFRIGPAVPPMFVIQGALDTLVWREESEHFVAALRAASPAPVVYAEVPGAQHAFDTFNSVRSRAAVDAIARFAAHVRIGRPPVADEGPARSTI